MNEPKFHESDTCVFLVKQYLRKPPEEIQLTNFKCVIKEFFSASNPHKNIQIVRFECIADFGVFYTEIKLHDLQKFNPSELDGRLYIAPENHLHNMFIIYFRQLLGTQTLNNKFLAEQLGDNFIKDHHVYIAGKLLLGSDINIDSIYFDDSLSKYMIEYDSHITQNEAFEWFGNFCAIEKGYSEIIGLHVLQAYIEPIYKSAHIPDGGTLIIVGDTQSKKTSLIQLGTTLYNTVTNHPVNTIRFDSSISSIQKHLSKFKTACAVLDDFFKCNVDGRGQTKTFQTIMRQIADNTIRETMHMDFDITHTQLFITAESLPDNVSDLGRMQVLKLTHPINSILLTPVQENQDKLIAFYVYFIDWAYSNYDSLLEFSKVEFTKFQIERQTIHCKWPRLYEHSFVSKLTLKIMLKYVEDLNIMSREEIRNMGTTFEEVIDRQQEQQTVIMEQIAKQSGEEALNIPRAIWCLIQNEIFVDEGRDSKCFFSYVENIKCIWVTTDLLLYELKSVFDFPLTVKKILKCLQAINALVTDENGSKSTKRSNKRRYAVIRLDILEYLV